MVQHHATDDMFVGQNRAAPAIVTATTAAAVAITTVAVIVAVTSRWLCIQRRRSEQQSNNTFATAVTTLIRPPLRNVTPLPGQLSQIVYLTGIDKETTQEELIVLFSKGGSLPIEVDLSEVSLMKGGGRAWALYPSTAAAQATVQALHQTIFHECTLCARLELGVEPKTGQRIIDPSIQTSILRGIQTRRGTTTKTESKRKKPIKARNKANISNDNTKIIQEDLIITACSSSKQQSLPVSYSHKSLSVGSMEYPFPSGMYLTRLIQELSKVCTARGCHIGQQQEQNLLQLLSNVSKLGGGGSSSGSSMARYAKELSEAFAMVDAVERAFKVILKTSVDQYPLSNGVVTCYCLGDGKYPVASSALALTMPHHWKFVSIDPILMLQQLDNDNDDNASSLSSSSSSSSSSFFHDRIHLFQGKSQDYQICKTDKDSNKICNIDTKDSSSAIIERPQLSIVVACHSHAPLEEFWDRLGSPKMCIAMPCCAQYSELPKEGPILEYDNFEVYSPQRRIRIFYS
jgi:hypothetical protein